MFSLGRTFRPIGLLLCRYYLELCKIDEKENRENTVLSSSPLLTASC